MKKPKILGLCGLLCGCFVLLTACSFGNSTSTKTTISNASATTKKVTQHYQNALSYLESGENKQAYDELKKIKNISQADKKIQALKKNLQYLLAAKKAVTAADMTTTKAKLAKLANVKTPTALVKQIEEVTKEYRVVKLAKHYAREIVQYYEAQNYTAAGGSLQALEALSSRYQAVAVLQEKYATYKEKIANLQATQATQAASQSSTSSAISTTESASSSSANVSTGTKSYTNARSSKILNSEYKKETGSELSSAPAEEVSSMSAKLDNQSVLAIFRKKTLIPQEAGDQYYVYDLGNDLYQIEIRHTSPTDPHVSNVKGMYQFNLTSGVAQKLNEVSGQYERLN